MQHIVPQVRSRECVLNPPRGAYRLARDSRKEAVVRPVDAALGYAVAGLRVFPLHRGSKRPAIANGLTGATTDPTLILNWWSGWTATYNIGLATGDGLAVVDVDPRHGGEVDPAWPKTHTVTTPSGGLHLYYATDARVPNSVGRLAPGVDVRGDGGYVVAPPSEIREVGRYEVAERGVPVAVLPEWMREAATTVTAAGSREGGDGSWGEAFVLLDDVGEGGRNHYMASLAGALFARGHGLADVERLMHQENRRVCVPPLSNAEVERVAASIERYHR